MKSKTRSGNTRKIGLGSKPQERSEQMAGKEPAPTETAAATAADFDDDNIDESELDAADDDRWDVFILDGDEPLPDYGDFWFPD